MSTVTARQPRGWLWAAGLVGLAAAAGVALPLLRRQPQLPITLEPVPVLQSDDEHVRRFCSSCHRYPDPDTFPRSAWKHEVERGFQFFEKSGLPLSPPPFDLAVQHFESRAPESLPQPIFSPPAVPAQASFERVAWDLPAKDVTPGIAGVTVARLKEDGRPELIASDMRHGHVLALCPSDPTPAWRTLARLKHPCRSEVVDLDGDGIRDLLVADLGSFLPTDRKCGSVVWLRGAADGSFTPFTLLEGVGRVADVRAADFRGTGRRDLVVAVFGWNQTGELLFLENRTEDWARPRFEPRVVDARHGTINVPVTDLDGDGRPDFVALIAQEHETVVGFLNRGGGKFEPRPLDVGDHPGLGSSGIELVDLDGDGDLDILCTNGDVLDQPYLLKPYHGIRWLENQGGMKYEPHRITAMYGVHRAVAADFDGDGDPDILAVAFLPAEGFPKREAEKLDAVVLLEQTAPGKFTRHTLEAGTCDHVACAVGDLFGTGRSDVAVGNFGGVGPPVTVWKNVTAGRRPAPGPSPSPR
jgi:hypothetical protein